MVHSTSTLGLRPEDITHRRVLRVAVPIVISNATVPILGAVDTGVVGQMGLAAPIGAVGIGAIIIASLYWLFGFLRMGTSGLVAQAHGARDTAETGAILMRALMIGVAGGAIFILLQSPFIWLAFKAAPASPEVEALAEEYLRIRIWGAPATIAIFAVTGWLIALERTRAVLVLQVWMNGLNIILDLWFVLGLDWGVEGVASATLIAEWSGLAMGLYFCREAFAGNQWRNWGRVFDPARLRRMAAVNSDILVRSVALNLIFVLFMFQAASFGDVTLAANQILLQFLEITAYALDGFAFAAEALVGQAMGAKMVLSLRRAAVLSSLWAAGACVAMAVTFALVGPWLIGVMTTSVEVREQANLYLWWVVFSPIVGLASWMLDGVFIGATRTRDMRRAALESLVVYSIVLFVFVAAWGYDGLWMALYASFVIRAVTLALRYPALERAARP